MLIDSRSVQRFLQTRGFYSREIDGDFGRKSLEGSRKFLRSIAPDRSSYEDSWSADRVRIAVEQALLESIGQQLGTIDGIAGPRTQVALERWQDHITFIPRSPDELAGVKSAEQWPRHTNEEMNAFYGAPGSNHTRIKPPYPVFYGDQPVASILINKRCAESASRILDRVLAEYGKDQIASLGLDRFGGCFNNRPMRGGLKLSTHAWACAWDWDAARNPLRATSATAQMAKPKYAGFIDAHEAEGWISLGRARNFDWMHFQAARLT